MKIKFEKVFECCSAFYRSAIYIREWDVGDYYMEVYVDHWCSPIINTFKKDLNIINDCRCHYAVYDIKYSQSVSKIASHHLLDVFLYNYKNDFYFKIRVPIILPKVILVSPTMTPVSFDEDSYIALEDACAESDILDDLQNKIIINTNMDKPIGKYVDGYFKEITRLEKTILNS